MSILPPLLGIMEVPICDQGGDFTIQDSISTSHSAKARKINVSSLFYDLNSESSTTQRNVVRARKNSFSGSSFDDLKQQDEITSSTFSIDVRPRLASASSSLFSDFRPRVGSVGSLSKDNTVSTTSLVKPDDDVYLMLDDSKTPREPSLISNTDTKGKPRSRSVIDTKNIQYDTKNRRVKISVGSRTIYSQMDGTAKENSNFPNFPISSLSLINLEDTLRKTRKQRSSLVQFVSEIPLEKVPAEKIEYETSYEVPTNSEPIKPVTLEKSSSLKRYYQSVKRKFEKSGDYTDFRTSVSNGNTNLKPPAKIHRLRSSSRNEKLHLVESFELKGVDESDSSSSEEFEIITGQNDDMSSEKLLKITVNSLERGVILTVHVNWYF